MVKRKETNEEAFDIRYEYPKDEDDYFCFVCVKIIF